MKMQSKIKGNGLPIILMPGGLTGWISWDPHADRLSATRKVIQVQLINVEYGFNNQPLPANYTVKTETLALAETLNDLSLTESYDFVAWSYGATVALDFALDHPEKIRSLTLIEPPALWVIKDKGALPEDLRLFNDVLQQFQHEITDEMLVRFMQLVGLILPGQNAREMPQWPLWKSYKLSLRNSPALIHQEDHIERLKNLHSPVLLVKGTNSAGFLHRIIHKLSNHLPQVSEIELPSGHAPHIVSMDVFLEKLAIFQNEAAGITSY